MTIKKKYVAKKYTGSKTSRKKSDRKSPVESATLYSVGTKKIGLDGEMWMIKKTSSGIHRWIKSKNNIKTRRADIKYQKDALIHFDADTIISTLNIPKPKKVASINVTTNKINVGELIIHKCTTKKGRYDIYQYGKSLIAIHQDENIKGKKFNFKGMVLCDIGMFSYTDTASIDPYVHRKTIDLRYTAIMLHNKIRQADDAYYLYMDDLEFDIDLKEIMNKERKEIVNQAKKITSKSKKRRFFIQKSRSKVNAMIRKHNTGKPKIDPVGIFSGNGYGDGSYLFFSSKNAFWIMSDLVEKKIFDLYAHLNIR